MLEKDKVYLVEVNSGNKDMPTLKYPAYGAEGLLEEDKGEVGWYDGDRFRIMIAENILINEDDNFTFVDSNGNIVSFMLLTVDLFEEFKEDLFMSQDLLKKEFDSNDNLQSYLIKIGKE